jgi:hypothetical protein
MKSKIFFTHAGLFFLLCLISAILPAQTPITDSSKTLTQIAMSVSNSKITYKIIDAPNKTFSYHIYVDARKLVHQPWITALSGNEGYKKIGSNKSCN